MAPSAAQPDLGQVVGAVDADAVDVGGRVGWKGAGQKEMVGGGGRAVRLSDR